MTRQVKGDAFIPGGQMRDLGGPICQRATKAMHKNDGGITVTRHLAVNQAGAHSHLRMRCGNMPMTPLRKNITQTKKTAPCTNSTQERNSDR